MSFRKYLRRPSPAMAVAGVALVSSFAGPAIAADVAQIAKKITGKDIANSSVTGKDVRNKSLTGKDVRNGSITGLDIKDGTLGGVDLAPGSVGSGQITDGSLSGTDLGADAVTGREVAENTLGVVPGAAQAGNAAALQGKVPADFVASERLVVGKAELKVGDPAETVVEFKGYRVTADCVDDGGVPRVRAIIQNVSAGTSQIHTWYQDAEFPDRTDNEFTDGDRMLLSSLTGTNWNGFKWEQYGALSLFNPDKGLYLWGGVAAVGVNVGDHDCVAAFRTLLT